PAQCYNRWVLEEEEYVMRQASSDAIVRKLALPLERVAIRYPARLDDFERVHGVTAPLPLMAQRAAMMPSAMLNSSQMIKPIIPRNRSSSAARKPTRHAPTAAATAMTPRCQMFSSEKLRYQAMAPPTPTAAIKPATSGLPPVSW